MQGYPRGGGRRGALKVFLGAAPGVGKTYRMLDDARRRLDLGTDLVVGLVESHGRRGTEEKLAGLEHVPRLHRSYRGAEFTEMDVDAVLARRPQVAVVDELAHTNVPGGRNDKRWQDVEELLAAGIDVLTTVNVQHLESLNDVVQKITGVPQRETVPDEVVRRADQIELVDMSPEGLRLRMSHGDIYAAEKVDIALSNYFRVGNLTALRELALFWLAGRVDEGMQKYRAEHGIERIWETRERIVVALTGGPEGETLIRRAARIADRSAGGDVLAVHVARSDGLADSSPAALADQRRLVESLGGSYHSVVGDDVARALIDFARAENATQLVLGTSRRSALRRSLTGRGIGETAVELSEDIDVHMVTHEQSGRGRLLPVPGTPRSVRRNTAGMVVGVLVPFLLTAVLSQARGSVDISSDILLFLLAVVGVALLGGVVSALLASLIASALLNYYFIPPIDRFTIYSPNNALALAVFAAVAIIVALVVDHAARLSVRAARATAEAETLSALAGSILGGQGEVEALLTRLRETFGMDEVTLRDRRTGAGPPDTAPAEGQAVEEVKVGEDAMLVLTGRPLPAADRRVLTAFAAHVAAALDRARLAAVAAEAEPVMATDRLRTALLDATTQDLRAPLAVATASVAALRSGDAAPLSAEEQAERLRAAEESLNRLDRLVGSLQKLSRLQIGDLSLELRPTDPAEVVAAALDSLTADEGGLPLPVHTQGLEQAPAVLAEASLLERVAANLLANALGQSGAEPVLVTARRLGDQVELRFTPGEAGPLPAPGPGLDLARGLTEAMGGTLAAESTPGGAASLVLSLPAAPAAQG